MITVAELIEFLEHFPEESLAYAYEGEIVGVVVRDSQNQKELGYISTEMDA